MKKKLLTIMMILVMGLNTTIGVSAKEIDLSSNFISDPNIEAIYYDQNGNIIVIKRDIPVDNISKNKIEQSQLSESLNPMSRASNPTYSSSLTPLNDRRELQARCEVKGGAIDSIWVSCTAFYPTGSQIGQSIEQSPAGYSCIVLSATVKVPSSPFDSLRVGSGYSLHQYEDSRYERVDHYLKYNM